MGRDLEKANFTESPGILKITPAGKSSVCHFWVGLFRTGSTSAQELFSLSDPEEIFVTAAREGLAEDEAIMLSNANLAPPRYVYLVPTTDSLPQRLDTKAVSAFVTALRMWQPQQAGLYIAPELAEKRTAQEMLLQILRESLLTTELREFCLLVGTLDKNDLLNTAIWLKEHLERESINVCVYH